jgi:hypothetical protein
MSETAGIEELRAFLLNRLPESERDRIEEALLRDEELFELSMAVEDELVDELLRGGLSEAEGEILSAYLSRLPDGNSRVRLARALHSKRRLREDRARPIRERASVRMKPLWAWLSPPGERFYRAAIVVLAVGVTLSTFKNLRLVSLVHEMREQLGRAEARIQALEQGPRQPGSDDQVPHHAAEVPRTASSTSASRSSDGSASPNRTAVLLTAGGFRAGGGERPLVRVSSKEVIAFMLDLGADDYPTYRAALCDADGGEIASASQLRAKGSDQRIVVTFPLPTDWLGSGDYFVALEGVTPSGRRESISRYDFRAQVDSPEDPIVPGR